MDDILRSSIECCQQVHEPFKGAIFGALFAEGRQVDNAKSVMIVGIITELTSLQIS